MNGFTVQNINTIDYILPTIVKYSYLHVFFSNYSHIRLLLSPFLRCNAHIFGRAINKIIFPPRKTGNFTSLDPTTASCFVINSLVSLAQKEKTFFSTKRISFSFVSINILHFCSSFLAINRFKKLRGKGFSI